MMITKIQISPVVKFKDKNRKTQITCLFKNEFQAEFESQNYVLPGTEIPKIEFPCLVLYEDS